MTNESLRTVEASGEDSPQGGRPSVVVIPERRRRYSSQEKMELVRLTYLLGNTVPSVAITHGVAPSMLFRWRALDKQGALTAYRPEKVPFWQRNTKLLLKRSKGFIDFSDRQQPIMLYSKTLVSICNQKMDCALAMIRRNHSVSRACRLLRVARSRVNVLLKRTNDWTDHRLACNRPNNQLQDDHLQQEIQEALARHPRNG